MTAYVTSDWSRVVREDDPEAAYGVAEVDLDRLGLRDAYETFVAPPPVIKQAPRPADKAVRRHSDK